MIEKSFINSQLGIKFNSYIDYKCGSSSKLKMSLKYLDIVTLKRLLNSMYLWKTK